MKQFNFEKAVARYNALMEFLGREHLTIGTRLSEDTDNWNIRDMVAEADYQLSTYEEDGHYNSEIKYGSAEERKIWKSETGRLRRFINAYLPYIDGLNTVSGHCSKYDNK